MRTSGSLAAETDDEEEVGAEGDWDDDDESDEEVEPPAAVGPRRQAVHVPDEDDPDPLVLMWAAEQRAKREGHQPSGRSPGASLQRMMSDLL